MATHITAWGWQAALLSVVPLVMWVDHPISNFDMAGMALLGFGIPAQQSDLIRVPAGHLGPGYYAWLVAGLLMLWTAFSSRSAA